MAKRKIEYNVYVIGLKSSFFKTKAAKRQNPDFVPGKNKRCYYVGYTSLTPEERYEKHLSKKKNKKGYVIGSSKVYNFAFRRNGLRPRKYKKYNPISSKDDAMKIEVELAIKLRKKGHCVYQA